MRYLHNTWRLLLDSRAPYFAAIALPILLGSALAWGKSGKLNLEMFVLSLLAGSFLQAGANMTNDFFDHKRLGAQASGTWAPPQQVLQGALGFVVVGTMVGLYIALATGPLVLLFGAVGIASSYIYSAPPLRLSGTGVGELLAGLNLGLLTTLGAFYVQTQVLDRTVVWAALPVALLMTATLALNGFRPAKLAANRSLWARMGEQRAALAYGVPALLAFALLILGVALDGLPSVTLLGLLGLPMAAIAVAGAQFGRLPVALLGAIGAHLSTTGLLGVAFVIQGFVTR